MIFKLNKVLIGILAVQSLVFYSKVHAADYKDERYGLTFSTENSANINSCLIGINPIARQIETSSIDIAGTLPFIRSYRSNLQLGFNPSYRNQDAKLLDGALAGSSVEDNSSLGIGWSHNYNYSLRVAGLNYVLIEPGDVLGSAKTFRKQNDGKIVQVVNKDQAGIQIIPSNQYEVIDNGVSVIVRNKNSEITFSAWNRARVPSLDSLQATSIKYTNGKILNLSYSSVPFNAAGLLAMRYPFESGYALASVSDNRGNSLQINRIGFNGIENSNNNIVLTGLISSVKTTTNNNLIQEVKYKYQIQNISTYGSSKDVAKLIKAESTKNGQEDYTYVDYLHSGIFANSSKTLYGATIPLLSGLIKNGEKILGWEATKETLKSSLEKPNYYSINSSLSFKETPTGGILEFIGPNRPNASGMGSETSGKGIFMVNNLNNTISYDGSNTSSYPYNDINKCIKINKIPVKKITLDKIKGSIVNFTDKRENLTEIEYDNKNRVTTVIEAKGNVKQRKTTNTYNTVYDIPSIINVDVLKLLNDIDIDGKVKSSTLTSTQPNSIPKTTNYDYYANGLTRYIDGPRSGTADRVNYTYDNFGNIETSSQTINGITRTTKYLNYNSYGLPERVVYPNGLVEQYIYNIDGTLKETRKGVGGEAGDISGQVTINTYNNQKLLESTITPDGEKTTYSYGIGDLVNQTSYPDGTKQVVQYNVLGIPIEIAGPVRTVKNMVYGDLITETWDGLTLPNQIVRMSSKKMEYDLNGNLITGSTSFDNINFNNTETWTYDALNRSDTHSDELGNIDTIGLDPLNNQISRNDALLGGSKPISYRNGNIKISEVNSDFKVKNYSYNEADMLTEIVHDKRKCSYPVIDELGRVKNYKCTSTIDNTPDNKLVDFSYQYDVSRFGRLDSITSASGFGVNTNYSYDYYDRITQKQQINKALSALGFENNSLTVNYGYSNAGKLTSLKLPSGKTINYVYENGNTGRLNSINIDGQPLVNYGYGIPYMIGNSNIGGNPGLLMYLNWSNGAKTSFGYGALGVGDLLSNISFKDFGNNSIVNLAYEFFDNKAISKITINDNQGTTFSDNFTYEKNGTLSSERRVRDGLNIFEIDYSYDQNKNRKMINAQGAHMHQSDYTYSVYYSASNKIMLTNSNVSGMQMHFHLPTGELILPRVEYDFAGRRISEQDNGTTNKRYMSYGNKNERTLKAYSNNNGSTWDSSKLVQYIYDENNRLIGEYNVSGQAIVEYVWSGDTPIAALYANGGGYKLYYIVSDINNTPKRLIDSTNNSIAWSWDGTAFGVGEPKIQNVKFNLRFPGQYYDTETKLHYNLNRYYSPELGRYIEPDRLGLEGGLNPYIYADANPVNKVDPSGAYAIRTEDANNIIYTIPAKFNLSSGVTDINRQALISTAESKLKTTYNGKNFIVKYVEVNEGNAAMYPIFNNITIKRANERNFGCSKGLEASGGCAAYVSNSGNFMRWDQMTLFSDSYPAMAHETMHVLGSDKERYSYIGNVPIPNEGWYYDVMGDKTQPVTKLSIDYIHRDGNDAIEIGK